MYCQALTKLHQISHLNRRVVTGAGDKVGHLYRVVTGASDRKC